MSIWLFRAGSNGEYENKFLNDRRIYLTWDDLDINLKKFNKKEDLYMFLVDKYDLEKEKTAINWASQIYPIAHRMEIGDWVVLPSKINRTIHFGKIVGDYNYDKSLGSPYYHYREVEWFAIDIPRDKFEQDILYSMGAFMTVCRIHKNNAEERIKIMYENNWNIKDKSIPQKIDESDDEIRFDLDEYIFDRISDYIIKKFKGHKMEILVEEILKAKGFTTYRSPEGADNGVDILAASDILGFGSPKICVQVKTTDSPIDRPTMDQLIGTMSNFNADYGLLVSWTGFKTSVTKEIPKQFFKLRLWDSKKIIEQLFENYDKLSEDIKTEIPLKRVWMLNIEE
ncbi:restriction endonuclease [Brevibacillus laterosporus]|uniref:restriction endonuclease n=1 Tax=Brevibacillus laterosporus TaxID=1465 RepID=UPI00036FFDBA|nr:restriction endonuclease [Brevibacillus laterosporus]ATO49882.1 restriction endonuclease [Brevibacillus laterosporus DSM 25]MBG9802514.1 restriction endonuclease [Brevibacillus laterosporus]MED2006095.1 restriction endonuclease [Brevibacillus laterosporus]MED4762868.1 restriction endonuclease [Brevibacillus laterosporus]TPH17982.1 restriction endonuclease [Brevibacillus laterosporus]